LVKFRRKPHRGSARVRTRAASEWARIYPKIRRSIRALCQYMNFEPTDQQMEVLRIVENESHLPFSKRKKRIAIKSGQGPGKTTVSVIIMLWRCLQDVNAMGIVTAPTMRQIKDVWLAEARRRMMDAHPILQKFIKVTKSRVLIGGEDYPDWGIKTMASSSPENTQGLHEKHLTVMVEEASGVEAPIIEQLKGTLTNEDSLLIMIGNPNQRDTPFFDCFNKLRNLFWTYTMNAEESSIVDQDNVRRIAEEFGRDSDVFRVRVLGEFPLQNPNTVLSSDDLEACARLLANKMARINSGLRQFGIDFARFGGDESVVYQRCGNAIIAQKIYVRKEPIEAIRYAKLLARRCGWENDASVQWVVDAGGLGQGLMHNFYEAGLTVHEFHSAGKPFDTQYDDQITEAFFNLRDLVRAREISIPNDDVLIKQLATRQYDLTKKGKIKVESKKEYVKRQGLEEGCGASPDRADAMVMAWYRGAIASGQIARKGKQRKTVGSKRTAR
jgi:phage terminase large subunit